MDIKKWMIDGAANHKHRGLRVDSSNTGKYGKNQEMHKIGKRREANDVVIIWELGAPRLSLIHI